MFRKLISSFYQTSKKNESINGEVNVTKKSDKTTSKVKKKAVDQKEIKDEKKPVSDQKDLIDNKNDEVGKKTVAVKKKVPDEVNKVIVEPKAPIALLNDEKRISQHHNEHKNELKELYKLVKENRVSINNRKHPNEQKDLNEHKSDKKITVESKDKENNLGESKKEKTHLLNTKNEKRYTEDHKEQKKYVDDKDFNEIKSEKKQNTLNKDLNESKSDKKRNSFNKGLNEVKSEKKQTSFHKDLNEVKKPDGEHKDQKKHTSDLNDAPDLKHEKHHKKHNGDRKDFIDLKIDRTDNLNESKIKFKDTKDGTERSGKIKKDEKKEFSDTKLKKKYTTHESTLSIQSDTNKKSKINFDSNLENGSIPKSKCRKIKGEKSKYPSFFDEKGIASTKKVVTTDSTSTMDTKGYSEIVHHTFNSTETRIIDNHTCELCGGYVPLLEKKLPAGNRELCHCDDGWPSNVVWRGSALDRMFQNFTVKSKSVTSIDVDFENDVDLSRLDSMSKQDKKKQKGLKKRKKAKSFTSKHNPMYMVSPFVIYTRQDGIT